MQSPWHDEDLLSPRWRITECGLAGVMRRCDGPVASAGVATPCELKRKLHLEPKGVRLLFVERHQQGDDEL